MAAGMGEFTAAQTGSNTDRRIGQEKDACIPAQKLDKVD
jgi:hypothetical protein